MSFGTNLSAIAALVAKPDTTLEAVLDDPALNAALRNSFQVVVSFLIENQNNLTRIMDMALSELVPDTPLPAKTVRTALQILTMGNSSTIMNLLNNNSMFVARINDFPSSEFASNPRSCGHYGRIVESFARYTSGQFLAKIPTLKPFLVACMKNLGMRELFINLLTDFPTAFGVNKDFFLEITQQPSPETAFFIVTALDNVTKTKRDIFNMICNNLFLANVLRIAKMTTARSLVNIEAFMLAERIVKQCGAANEEVAKTIEQESNSYDFAKQENDAILSASLRVLHTTNDGILLRLFTDKRSTFLNDGIIRSLEALSSENLAALNERTQFSAKLMEAFPNSPTNVHLSKAAKLLQSLNNGTEIWNKFIEETVNPRNEQREGQYGGSRPHIHVSSSSDSDSGEIGETMPANDEIAGEDLFGSDSSSSSSDSDSDDDDGNSSNLFSRFPQNNSNSNSDSDDETNGPFGIKAAPKQLHKFGSKVAQHNFNSSSSSDSESDSLGENDGNRPAQVMAKAPPLNINFSLDDDLHPFPGSGLPAFPGLIDSDLPPIPKGMGSGLLPPPFPGLFSDALPTHPSLNSELPPPPPFPNTSGIQLLNSDDENEDNPEILNIIGKVPLPPFPSNPPFVSMPTSPPLEPFTMPLLLTENKPEEQKPCLDKPQNETEVEVKAEHIEPPLEEKPEVKIEKDVEEKKEIEVKIEKDVEEKPEVTNASSTVGSDV